MADPMADLPPIPEDEFCVFGIVYADSENADALEATYAQTTALARTEPGIVYYCICRDDDDRAKFHFFERYKGRKAFEEHNNHPLLQKLREDKLIKAVEAKFVKAIEPTGGEW